MTAEHPTIVDDSLRRIVRETVRERLAPTPETPDGRAGSTMGTSRLPKLRAWPMSCPARSLTFERKS